MYNKYLFFLPLLAIFATSCGGNANSKQETMQDTLSVKPPIAQKLEHITEVHGLSISDPYFWMRLSDEQKEKGDSLPETKAVRDYLNAENEYTQAALAHTASFQEKLFEEMKGRIKEDDQSVPYKDNGYWYYTRFEKGQDYSFYCRKKDSMENGTEEVLVNGPERAKGKDYWAVGGMSISEDNQILAFSEDIVSRRQYTIQFRNLATGKEYSEKIINTTGGITWAADNKTVFYTMQDPTSLRSFQVWKHKLGADQSTDQMIYQEDDETFNTFVYKTKSDKFLVIGNNQTVSSEYRILDANTPDGEWKMFQVRERDHEYGIDHYNDKFYIVTNWNAKNFKLMETALDKTTKENWRDVIAHRDDVLLEGIEIFKDYLVVDERKNGLNQLRIINWTSKAEHYIEFQDAAYTAYTGTNPDFNTEVLRYGYSSLVTPNSTYDYNMSTKERTLLKQQEIVGGYDVNNYSSERIMVTARDGVKVPVSIVYRKGFEKNGKAPCLLYAYGSYGSSTDAYFSSTRLSLIDRGFVFAIAHIRGGSEMGRQWYEDGKMFKKMNTFNDFIDCADALVKEQFASKDNLFAMGGSAGGLLMGAVVNMRPELWKGIVAAVPFVDVINTMLDETIPLTTGEFDEWGNPKIKEQFDYMMTYSPYDNVKAQSYPNMLVTTGFWDSQVQYWEPAKWVAKLREMKTDSNRLFLHTNMDSGHGGQSGRFRALKEYALEYAFMLDLAGIKE
ncbi:MAG: S9 family peptidase [Flavobacteriales bacterium]|nr:S9 family peptidase [Flavobacteriales bacterium]